MVAEVRPASTITVRVGSTLHEIDTNGLSDEEITQALIDATGEPFTYSDGAVSQP